MNANGRLKPDQAGDILDALLEHGYEDDFNTEGSILLDDVILSTFTEYDPAALNEIVEAVGETTLTDALLTRLYGKGDTL